MNYRHPLLTAAAAAALVGVASAQLTPNDYNYNWVNMGYGNSFAGGAGFTTGPVLFGAITGQGPGGNYAGPGDSVRVCYGIDSFQGGRNQTGSSEQTWFAVVQGHDSLTPLVDIGLVSFHAQSVDSLEGDACFSSVVLQGNDSGGNPVTLNAALNFAAIIGQFPGTTLGAGFFYTMYFEFIGSTGVLSETTLGNDPQTPINPLLTHFIYEIQGPVNGGPGDNQYYLASTSEALGTGDGLGNFTGGVTNGNGLHGAAPLGGGTAQPFALGGTGALSHNRLTGYSPAAGLGAAVTVFFNGEEKDMWLGFVGTRTPQLWGVKSTPAGEVNSGGGGPDWVVSTAPVSNVTMRALDVLSGGQGASLDGNPGATVADNPFLLANLPVFVYSTTPATNMITNPYSWDDLGGAVPAQPGSIILGSQATARAGLQTVPANFDATTVAFLKFANLTIGNNFTTAFDSGLDGNTQTLFQDGHQLGDGTATWNLPGLIPAASAPNPANLGLELGIAGVGIQFDVLAGTLGLTEVYSACNLILQ